MVKKHIRIMGLDDAPFEFRNKNTLVVGIVIRTPAYVESVLSTEVMVDGTNSTEKLMNLIEGCRHREQLKAIMIDGAAFGGFNIIDIKKLYDKFDIPIITVTRNYPDFEKIHSALKDHFEDWENRWKLITEGELIEIDTQHTPIYVKINGISKDMAMELIKLTTVRGVIPEPIRLAHLIASGIATGESQSKA
jgi:endonuclease V-like protein UPF0215 family